MSMEKYQSIIDSLQQKFEPNKFQELLEQIKARGAVIFQKQTSNPLPKISLTNYIRNNILNCYPHTLSSKNKYSQWFIFYQKIIKVIYQQKPTLKTIIYKSLPAMVTKLIQLYASEIQGLDECFIIIYNKEFQQYNKMMQEKSEPSKNASLRSLYQKHMVRQMYEFQYENLYMIQKINNTNRDSVKNLAFYLIYRATTDYGKQSLVDFYHLIFIYCGVDQKEVFSPNSSLYLLQKTKKISLFRFSISNEEASWIILTLYQLYTRFDQDKFDLISTINVLHKKVSNQCQFKMSQIAQSLLQLLEDEYSSVFS